jgi:hypothetical protein
MVRVLIILLSFALLPLFLVVRAAKKRIARLTERRQLSISYKIEVSRMRRRRRSSHRSGYYGYGYNQPYGGLNLGLMMMLFVVFFLLFIAATSGMHHH